MEYHITARHDPIVLVLCTFGIKRMGQSCETLCISIQVCFHV